MGLGGSLVVLFAALDLVDRPARGPHPARAAGQRRRARLAEAPRRPRRAPHRERLLVPPLALRDAPADPGRDPLRRLPDPARPALLRDQVQHRRPERSAAERRSAGHLRTDQRRVPALPRNPDRHLVFGRWDRRGTGVRGPRRQRVDGVAQVLPPRRLARRRLRDRSDLRAPLHRRRQPDDGEGDPRPAGVGRRHRPGRRRHGRLSSTSRGASPPTCRSRWRSSSSPPWWSSS